MKQVPIILTTEQMGPDDVILATDPGVLVLAAPTDNASRLVAATQGVLTVPTLTPAKAS